MTRKGRRSILDAFRRGVNNFGSPPKGGGRKILDLMNFSFKVPKTQFFHVLGGIWGTFHFLVLWARQFLVSLGVKRYALEKMRQK